LNDFYEILRDNIRIIIPAAVVVVVIAVVIGIFVGLRNPSGPGVSGELAELLQRDIPPDRDETGLFVPGPVVPRLYDSALSEDMYPGQRTDYLDSLEFKNIDTSELIEHRPRGVEVHIKPFRIENVELEILSEKDELAEP
jgi:hypothetical protein